MKPIIGISKNLGHGLRVGIAIPIIPEPKLSKREQANEKFIRDARGRVERAMLDYLFSHGMLVTTGTMHRLSKDALAAVSEPIESVEQNMLLVGDSVRMYNDTGSITQPAKEKIMRNVYEIENALSKNAGSSDLFGSVNSLKREASAKVAVTSSAGILLVALGSIVGYAASMWMPFFVGLAAGSFIQYKSKKRAVAAKEAALAERMSRTRDMIVAGSVSLEDYVTGRV